MPAISEILINSQTHTIANNDPLSITGDALKGDGYYGWGDGIHTIEVELTNFVGRINIQASLATAPSDNDWFSVPLNPANTDQFRVDTTGLMTKIVDPQIIEYSSPTTSVKMYNFTGNFVWVRAYVDNWTQGSVNRILFNH